MRREAIRKRIKTTISVLAVFLIVSTTAVLAQARYGTGAALDRSFNIGSGGYNRAVPARGYMPQSHYYAGSSRPVYTVDRQGNMRYNPHNAFSPQARYRPTGYTGDMTSYSHHQRFRYQGW
jgi:hypothetical protein